MAWPDGIAGLPAPGSIPHDDPRNAAWRALLPPAAALVAAADGAVLPRLTLGGGSMLAARYGHRESRDLDFFLPDAQLLAFLAPRLNDAVAAIAGTYEEASNVLRFRFGAREVDFIVGAAVLDRVPSAWLDLAPGARVPVEPPGEIAAGIRGAARRCDAPRPRCGAKDARRPALTRRYRPAPGTHVTSPAPFPFSRRANTNRWSLSRLR